MKLNLLTIAVILFIVYMFLQPKKEGLWPFSSKPKDPCTAYDGRPKGCTCNGEHTRCKSLICNKKGKCN